MQLSRETDVAADAHNTSCARRFKQSVAVKISSRAYVLKNGRIVMSGPGERLLHDDRVRQAYLGL